MTNTKFSGPWHVISDSQGYDNIHHAPADDGDTGDIVAACYQDSEHARLISAAPELYDALVELISVAGFPITDRQAAIFDKVRAAIAKARGEA